MLILQYFWHLQALRTFCIAPKCQSHTKRQSCCHILLNFANIDDNGQVSANIWIHFGRLLQTKVNDLPNTEFDKYWLRNTMIYKYHIEFFFFFICFESQLGKFERELDEKIIYNS